MPACFFRNNQVGPVGKNTLTNDLKGDLPEMGGKKKEEKQKPLDKMTVKELRDLAKQETDIQGVYGMNKPELISGIKKARGIEETAPKKSDTSVREIKHKMRALRVVRESALKEDNSRMAEIIKKRISRLKKKTRKAA